MELKPITYLINPYYVYTDVIAWRLLLCYPYTVYQLLATTHTYFHAVCASPFQRDKSDTWCDAQFYIFVVVAAAYRYEFGCNKGCRQHRDGPLRDLSAVRQKGACR